VWIIRRTVGQLLGATWMLRHWCLASSAARGRRRATSPRRMRWADVAASIGFDRAVLRAGIECPETKAGLQSTVADAVARGIFGSPFIIVDGEPFWGADRLPMVERWLVSPW
jgi:hypothetical protein